MNVKAAWNRVAKTAWTTKVNETCKPKRIHSVVIELFWFHTMEQAEVDADADADAVWTTLFARTISRIAKNLNYPLLFHCATYANHKFIKWTLTTCWPCSGARQTPTNGSYDNNGPPYSNKCIHNIHVDIFSHFTASMSCKRLLTCLGCERSWPDPGVLVL